MEKDCFLRGQVAKEFDFCRIREKIALLAASEEGKESLLSRESTSDPDEISFLKNLGRQWSLILNSENPQRMRAWPPVKEYFSALEAEGASLAQDQIFALGLFCRHSMRAKKMILDSAEKLAIPDLKKCADEIPALDNAAEGIFSVLEDDGEIRNLPELRETRATIAALKKEIDGALRKYTSDNSLCEALQSNVPALRAERELLAVKADHRNSVRGIVHEASASGQTLYIEPDEIVRANNELVQEEARLQGEINKIFRRLTASLARHRRDFEAGREKMILLDSACAAARWQNETGGIFAQDIRGGGGEMKIVEARHPLLEGRAVPVTMNFMPGKNVLIVTGPNAGGKTVALKTIALFSLLNQAGFPVPAAEGTTLRIFNSIFADIGDEQSIDESLSTFSSRMKKIALALNHADENSLVLLDELGTGTDPQEGGAIAMAVLDSLLEKKSFVVATTHHGALKNYGYTNPKCVNASVEFSGETLRPTYRLLMGVPGESHAIEIARNSGLPQDAVERAKEAISTQRADVSALIKGLVKKHEELDSILEEARRKELELSQKEFKIHQRETKMLEREVELKKNENSESSKFLRETRSRLENLVRVLREGEITREKTLGVRKFISDLEEEIDARERELSDAEILLESERKSVMEEEKILANGMRISPLEEKRSPSKKSRRRVSNSEALKTATALEMPERLKNARKNSTAEKKSLEQGMEVFAGKERRKGVLVRKEKHGTWQVQFGSMKMTVPESQLAPAERRELTADVPIVVSEAEGENSAAPKFELRLLGMRCEDAIKALERQLDLCSSSGFGKFSVIHGKGNGILQKAVHDYLSRYPSVREYRFARPEDGGTGKTYVELF